MIFAIDGIDRTGKTTLINYIKELCNNDPNALFTINKEYAPNFVNLAIERQEHFIEPFLIAMNRDIDLVKRCNDIILMDRGYLSSLIYSIDPFITYNMYSNHTDEHIIRCYIDSDKYKWLNSLRKKVESFVLTNSRKEDIENHYRVSDFKDDNVDWYERRFLNYETYYKYQMMFNKLSFLHPDNINNIEMYHDGKRNSVQFMGNTIYKQIKDVFRGYSVEKGCPTPLVLNS